MKNNVAITCKASAVVLFILCFIGSIVFSKNFNFQVFASTIIRGFLFSLLLFAIGEIIELLYSIYENTYKLHYLNRKVSERNEKIEG
mgnify:CR=1 FL=1